MAVADSKDFEFFAGETELAGLMRAKDWSATPLGDPSTWPQSLRTTVRIILTSKFAMWMGWGRELTFFYNDVYARDTLVLKHPWALGQPARRVWAEIWNDIGPLIEGVIGGSEATWQSDMLLFLERSGFREETYHTFSYQPISDDTGAINGMLCVVTEETQRVVSERRMALLRELASSLGGKSTEREVMRELESCLSAHSEDAPFTLTYLLEPDGQGARLACSTNVPKDSPMHVAHFKVDDPASSWPIAKFLEGGKFMRVPDIESIFGAAPTGPWKDSPSDAVIVPIAQRGQSELAGFLIAGVNPYRPLDDEYAGFFELLTGQVAAGLANARAYETERKRAEELAKIDAAKTAFFSNVSHELRTPLTLILGPLEDELARMHADRENSGLAIAHRNSLRLLKLVNTLLDFTRIESGRTSSRFEPVDLPTLTRDLVSNFSSAADRAGIRLEFSADEFAQPVYVDREMWEKIVLNLVSNAFKHTFSGGIRVCVSEKDGEAVLTVRDTGTGIPPDELPKIFERFHRVDGVARRSHEGTGIGLALVKELVLQHRGEITAASELASGSTFTVRLPLGSSHLPRDRVVEPDATVVRPLAGPAGLTSVAYVEETLRWLPDDPTSGVPQGLDSEVSDVGHGAPLEGGRARIVLADDNPDMREYMRRVLSVDYKVEAVADGQLAMEAIRRERPALLLTDVMMPRLDGFELLRTLRSDAELRDLPIIMLSARAGEEAKVEGLEEGADDYMGKPFSTRELLARIQSNLKLDQVRREAHETERRLRQEAEAVSSRFDFVMRRMQDLLVMYDSEWRYVYVSDSVETFTGYLRSELLGKSVWEVFPYLIGSELERRWRRCMELGESQRFDFYVERLDRWMDYRVEPAIDGISVLAIDITDRIQAERELERRVEERTAELVEANRQMEGFTYSISHDLRTPLRSIVYNSGVLLEDLEDELSERHRELLKRQARSALKLAALIDDLLRLSRVSRQAMERTRLDFTALAESAAEESSSVYPGIEFSVQKGLVASGDENLLRLVLRNLLENAAKFSPAGGAVEVGRSGLDGPFFVRDEGIGLDVAYAQKIFEPFERLVTDAEFPGTGIGLANVKLIVERHGGQVWVESKPGAGATFFFTLPA